MLPPKKQDVEGLSWIRWVAGYEGAYAVTRCGKVASYKRHNGSTCRWLSAVPPKNGYATVGLQRQGARKTVTVHTLVAEAFIGPRPEGYDTCHNDGDKANNHVDNLRYGTRAENCADMAKHGTLNRGERQWNAKITEDDVRSIRRLYAEGGVTQCELGERFGIALTTVNAILKKRTWAHVP